MPNNVTQTSPEPPSDTVQAVQTMTIEIKGQETEALKLALEAVMRLVSSCLLYTSPSPRDRQKSRMPSSA